MQKPEASPRDAPNSRPEFPPRNCPKFASAPETVTNRHGNRHRQVHKFRRGNALDDCENRPCTRRVPGHKKGGGRTRPPPPTDPTAYIPGMSFGVSVIDFF